MTTTILVYSKHTVSAGYDRILNLRAWTEAQRNEGLTWHGEGALADFTMAYSNGVVSLLRGSL